MEYCKLVITPMQTKCKLRKYDDSKSTDQRQCRSMIVVRKIGLRSNKIKQMQKQNTEDTQYKRDIDLRGSPSVGYVHQRNCQVLQQNPM
jgi:hypothetical protein